MKKLDITEEIVQVFVEAMAQRDMREKYIESLIWGRHKFAVRYALKYNQLLHKAWSMADALYPERTLSEERRNWRLGDYFITILDEDE